MFPDWVKIVQDVNRPLGRKRFGKLFKGHIFSLRYDQRKVTEKIKDVSEGNVMGLGIQ